MPLIDLWANFSLYGTAVVNLCVSALDVFFCDNEGNEPIRPEVGRIGTHTYQFEFLALTVIADVAGAPFSANEMKFAAPAAHDSIASLVYEVQFRFHGRQYVVRFHSSLLGANAHQSSSSSTTGYAITVIVGTLLRNGDAGY